MISLTRTRSEPAVQKRGPYRSNPTRPRAGIRSPFRRDQASSRTRHPTKRRWSLFRSHRPSHIALRAPSSESPRQNDRAGIAGRARAGRVAIDRRAAARARRAIAAGERRPRRPRQKSCPRRRDPTRRRRKTRHSYSCSQCPLRRAPFHSVIARPRTVRPTPPLPPLLAAVTPPPAAPPAIVPAPAALPRPPAADADAP